MNGLGNTKTVVPQPLCTLRMGGDFAKAVTIRLGWMYSAMTC